MDTKSVKHYYNESLTASQNSYEGDRWLKNAQSRSAFSSTKNAVEQFALPYLKETDSVFELGPGPGTWTKILLNKAPQAKYDLVDISEEMLAQAKDNLGSSDNINYICSDILDYTPSKTYDYFFSSRIIEYVPDKDSAIKSISDCLKSGGYGYIVTKMPQKTRPLSRPVTSDFHSQQILPDKLAEIFEKHGCLIINKVHVTCVFPGLRSGFADRMLTKVMRLLPFSFGRIVSESYAIVFRKK